MSTLTTELEMEAVNEMLAAIGETEVASLDDDVVEATGALRRLRKVSKSIQGRGWFFNTIYNIELWPDTDGRIALPENTLDVKADNSFQLAFYNEERGGNLFDYYNDTDIIDRMVRATIITYLTFDQLPLVARDFVTAAAVRSFHAQENGDPSLKDDLRRDEFSARSALKSEQNKHRRRTMIDNGMQSPLSSKYGAFGRGGN